MGDAQGNPVNPVVMQGGSISLKAPAVSVGNGAHLDASGGAMVAELLRGYTFKGRLLRAAMVKVAVHKG